MATSPRTKSEALKPGLMKAQKTISSPAKLSGVSGGIYLLEIHAAKDFNVRIKRFEGVNFPAGYYYYAGSAQKNFYSRIKRHLSDKKKIHWHIDHVTSVSSNSISKIYFIGNAGKDVEKKLASDLIHFLKCKVIVEKFGCSDTPESVTHLVYRSRPISYSHLTSLYHSMVRFIPSSIDTRG